MDIVSSKTTVVLSLGRSEDPGRQALERDLHAALSRRPRLQSAVVPHLVDLAPDGPAAEYLRRIDGDMIVVAWLYARAAYWLLDAHQVRGRAGSPPSAEQGVPAASNMRTDDVADRTIWCLDFRSYREVKSLVESIERIVAETGGQHTGTLTETIRVEESTKYRWYPVIDYSRCKNCMECLNFCLFGVLGVDESQQILVEQPDACRNGCPACSRVCPSQAIMFPEHQTPAIAGDPTVSSDGFQLNLVQLLGMPGTGGMAPGIAAAAERDRALAEKTEAENAPRDDLDDLVDDLDKMDL